MRSLLAISSCVYPGEAISESWVKEGGVFLTNVEVKDGHIFSYTGKVECKYILCK